MDSQCPGPQPDVTSDQQCLDPPAAYEERAWYLQQGPEQIYCVRHASRIARLGQVLLVGPFAHARESVYIPWVRWARALAAGGLEVLRFDYRGAGESTGDFAQMDFGAWMEDVHRCVHWLREHGNGCPLVLHGLELGALMAARAFRAGVGDALLLWSPPSCARDILRQALQRLRAQEYAVQSPAPRRAAGNYAEELDAGRPVVVNGYTWSPGMWRQSAEFALPESRWSADCDGQCGVRPYRVVHLDLSAGPLLLPSAPARASRTGVGQLSPDLSALFRVNLGWIRQCLDKSRHETDPSN